jgi:hypothetical protein
MTLKHLRELLNAAPLAQENREIQVWLPGSRIALSGELTFKPDEGWLIEGNLKPGSALEAS